MASIKFVPPRAYEDIQWEWLCSSSYV